MKMKIFLMILLLSILMGCAAVNRGCSRCTAENFGGDWIVAQINMDGKTIRAWKLNNVAIVNEPHSDGIYWKEGGHLIHISGWYNRIQIQNGEFERAASLLGLKLEKIKNGTYTE